MIAGRIEDHVRYPWSYPSIPPLSVRHSDIGQGYGTDWRAYGSQEAGEGCQGLELRGEDRCLDLVLGANGRPKGDLAGEESGGGFGLGEFAALDLLLGQFFLEVLGGLAVPGGEGEFGGE